MAGRMVGDLATRRKVCGAGGSGWPGRFGRIVAAGLILMTAAGGPGRKAEAQSVAAVPQLDMKQLVGSWYEIARYPNKLEKRCMSDAVALYTLADKRPRFAVVNSCRQKDGSIDTRNAKGKPQDKSGDGKLKIAYTWPFYRKFWVLAMAPDGQWTLMGSPNRKFLWILAHAPTLPEGTLAEIRARAAAEGYDVSKLVMNPQNPRSD